jgi:hypothetical protein
MPFGSRLVGKPLPHTLLADHLEDANTEMRRFGHSHREPCAITGELACVNVWRRSS